MIDIQGKIKRITYYNHENGYGVVRAEIRPEDAEKIEVALYSNEITIVSNFAKAPFIDEVFDFSGTMVESKYGMQFKAEVVRPSTVQSEAGIVAYLSSDVFGGIGVATARRIYETFGDETIKIISSNRASLDLVPKLTKKQKDTLYETLKKFSEEEKVLVELLSYGLTLKLSNKLLKSYKSKTLTIVKENPYDLINKVEGIGFLRADEIAYKVGIKKDSDVRLKALIVYILNNIVYDSGNTFMHLNDLYLECLKFEQKDNSNAINKENYVQFIHELVDEKRIIVDEEHNVYEVKTYYEENSIAKNIYNFLNHRDPKTMDSEKLDAIIHEVEKQNKIQYNDKQLEAIHKAMSEPIVIVTGGPGTGKSTVIKGIIETFARSYEGAGEELIRNQIVLAAPTGRAAKRLKEVTGHNASTIHKLLGYTGQGFMVEEIEAKLIIIDEFSMVDTALAYQLFKSIPFDTKIVIVGDADQLPAVGPGDILNDLILSKELSVVRLTKIHRQVETSSIISMAHFVNEGKIPYDILYHYEDRNFVKSGDNFIIPIIVSAIRKYLQQGYNLIEDIQVLVPMYNVGIGINSINTILQDEFNPILNLTTGEYIADNNGKVSEIKEVKIGLLRYRINDKVIQLKNRADKGIMNGDIGCVQLINVDEKTHKPKGITVKYDIGDVEYEMDELDEIRLAYAISIHKSQGSEFKVAIVPFSFKYYIMLKRKLIYTAITRAKNHLEMMGNFEALCKGVTTVEEKRRTLLKEKLQDLINNNGEYTRFKIGNDTLFEEKLSEDFDEDINPYSFMK